ncbi:MAG: hypothetical protein ACYDD1_12450 [Caulobacteraceae bacterium]
MADRPSFEISADTRLLLQRLLKVEPGEAITFGDLSLAIGRKVEGADGHLQSARRMAERDHCAVFSSIIGKGYQRLLPAQVVAAAEHGLHKIKRAAKREGNRLATVDPLVLDQTNRDLMNARMSGLAIIVHVTRPPTIEKLTGAVRAHGEKLAISQTLMALTSGEL